MNTQVYEPWKKAISEWTTLVPKNDQKAKFKKEFLETIEKIGTKVKEIQGTDSKKLEARGLATYQNELKKVYADFKNARGPDKATRDPKGNVDRGLKILIKQLDAIVAAIQSEHHEATSHKDLATPSTDKQLAAFKLELKKKIAEGATWLATANAVTTGLKTKHYPTTVAVPNTETAKLGNYPDCVTEIPALIDKYQPVLQNSALYQPAQALKTTLRDWFNGHRTAGTTIENIDAYIDGFKRVLKNIPANLTQ
jgi:hypothetical protein